MVDILRFLLFVVIAKLGSENSCMYPKDNLSEYKYCKGDLPHFFPLFNLPSNSGNIILIFMTYK